MILKHKSKDDLLRLKTLRKQCNDLRFELNDIRTGMHGSSGIVTNSTGGGKYLYNDPTAQTAIRAELVQEKLIDAMCESIELELDIRARISALTPNQREAVQCVYIDGLSYEQAARRMGISKWHCRRLAEHAVIAMDDMTPSSLPDSVISNL